VRYMPGRVLRQFGRVQTISRHPIEVAPPDTNFEEISLRFQYALDHTLTPEQLGAACSSWRGGSRWIHRVVLSPLSSTHDSS